MNLGQWTHVIKNFEESLGKSNDEYIRAISIKSPPHPYNMYIKKAVSSARVVVKKTGSVWRYQVAPKDAEVTITKLDWHGGIAKTKELAMLHADITAHELGYTIMDPFEFI